MVCPRCVMVVEQLLEKNSIPAVSVRLGEVELTSEPTRKQLEQLSADLSSMGFELLDDQKKQLIERIKQLIIKKVQQGDMEDHFSVSKYLGKHIHRDYSSISKLFSEVEGVTIEQFLILQKIEKAKEWLAYDEMTLAEIAFELGYSSPQHLSNQFKKLTGMTASEFKKLGVVHRKPLDNVSGDTN